MGCERGRFQNRQSIGPSIACILGHKCTHGCRLWSFEKYAFAVSSILRTKLNFLVGN